MEEARIKGKTARSVLSLEQRVRSYEDVLQLRRLGLSYNQIIGRINRTSGIRLARSTVEYWARGIQRPLGNVNTFDVTPRPALAYVIGGKAGDAWLCKYGYDYLFGLTVNDYEFAAETGRQLAKLLGRERPYEPYRDKTYRRWRVTCYSVLLYRFLDRPRQQLKPYIEHCKNCVSAFLRALFDSESSISGRDLILHNTDKELLLYAQRLLRRYFGIDVTGPHEGAREGTLMHSIGGKVYRRTKTCYYLRIRVNNLLRFHRYVEFTIERKKRDLRKALQQ